MNCTKHCNTLRQPCTQPWQCANGCYATPLEQTNCDGSAAEVTPTRPWHSEPRGLRLPFLIAAAVGAGFGVYRYFF